MTRPFNQEAANRSRMTHTEIQAAVNELIVREGIVLSEDEGEAKEHLSRLVLHVLHERYVQECEVDELCQP